jgi:DNA-directed RNA polymerase specialized sigma24 family protein
LARTETRLEEVAQQADQKVEVLGNIAAGKTVAVDDAKGAPSVSVRDMVIKLKHQGWKIEDIAKSCKISRGEVELILEMAHR